MQRIEQLDAELASIKAERDKLNNEATDWAEKRDSLHAQIRNLRKESNSLKEKRDALNQEVKEFKNLREQAKTKGKEKHNKIRRTEEQIKTLLDKKPVKNQRAIRKEIEGIEWKIQTTSLPVKQEEKLIGEVKHLEIQQTILKQLEESKNRLIELQAEEKSLATKATFHHEKLSELAEQSQKLHERRLGILNHIKNLQVEANNAHQKYVQIRRKADGIHQRFVELLQKINHLKQRQRRAEEVKQAERHKQLLEEARRRALGKIRQGEKLALEEFKLLSQKETRVKRAPQKRNSEEE